MIEVDVLGTKYKIKEANSTTDTKLKEINGYCDNTIKVCVIDECNEDHPMGKSNMKNYKDKVKRHELIHAFLFESGLAENSQWATNEELVDWIAFQFPKLSKAFNDVGCSE